MNPWICVLYTVYTHLFYHLSILPSIHSNIVDPSYHLSILPSIHFISNPFYTIYSFYHVSILPSIHSIIYPFYHIQSILLYIHLTIHPYSTIYPFYHLNFNLNKRLVNPGINVNTLETPIVVQDIQIQIQIQIQNLFIAHKKKSYHINSNTSWNSLVQKSQKKQCLYMPDPCAYLININ